MHRSRHARFVIIACICLICLLLLFRNASDVFALSSLGEAPLVFGFSTLVAAIYLATGSVVWLYASNRLVALLLFGYASAMAATFAVETGAKNGDPLLSLATSISSLLSLLLLNSLLLVFPRNALALPASRPGIDEETAGCRSRFLALLLRGYLCALVALCGLAIGSTLLIFLGGHSGTSRISLLVFGYGFLGLVGCLVANWLSYRRASNLRERQQLRLLVNGAVISLVPFLVLTLLPLLLNFPPQLVVNSQLSTTTLVILPLAIGYAILRYQILVFDTYIRRVAVGLVGLLSLAVTSYLVVAASELFFPSAQPQQAGFVILSLIMLGSAIWWLARGATERVFFSEIGHYRRLLNHPDRLVHEISDLNEAAWLIAAAVVDAFETSAACLFILDEEAGCFRPHFPIKGTRAASVQLLGPLFSHIKPVVVTGKQTDWLDAADPLLVRLAQVSRPLLLSELNELGLHGEAGLPHLLPTTRGGDADPLLVPVRTNGRMVSARGTQQRTGGQQGAPARTNGRMVGILVVGARGDLQAYAGPDFEAIDLILSRFAPVLEIARLYALGSSYAALVMKLYTGMPRESFDQYSSLEEVARGYARVVASATSSHAEVWLAGTEEDEQVLRPLLHIGSGPSLTEQDSVRIADIRGAARTTVFATWRPSQSFSELLSPSLRGQPPSPTRSSTEGTTSFPFAWLPLVCNDHLHGVLALTYQRPHTFSEGERRLLEVFAHQCATALEGTRTTLELSRAYAMQLEQDRRRDQLLQAASHGLCIPLTIIGGYIELLLDHGSRLPPETRAEFLARAQRGSTELVLMINQIMDALLPPPERKPLSLRPVSLLEAIKDVIELRAIRIQSEQRTVSIELAADLHVLADPVRLCQVLLSLLNNALASSPSGSAIEIYATRHEGQEVTVHMRDHGTKIPPEAQADLFTPFPQAAMASSNGLADSGLGLFVSKQLLAAMDGDLWLERSASDGAGNTFAFSLPSSGRQLAPVEGAYFPE